MEYIIIGGDNYNTLGMIRTLGEAKIYVHAVIVKNEFKSASKSRYIDKLVLVNSIQEGYEYLVSIKKNDKNNMSLLLVEGDLNTTYLDEHYEDLKQYYIYSQAKGNIRRYMDKNEQVTLAQQNGLNVMETVLVKRGEIPENITYPVITKARSSLIGNWKKEVHICNNEKELKDAFSQIESDEVLVQRFVKKKNELCLDGYSINGGKDQVITIASSYNYIIPGEYAYALTMFNYVDDKNLMHIITKMMTEVGYEGIYSIEFLVDEEGNYWFLEINFRNSGWSYASTVAGMPLPLLWADSMISGEIDNNIVKPIKEGFVFIDDINDFKARVEKGDMPFYKWLREYLNADCRLLLGRNDPIPMISYIACRIKKKTMKRKNNR